jgi:septal ring factor EnvC (AmiA/AmiB activator)
MCAQHLFFSAAEANKGFVNFPVSAHQDQIDAFNKQGPSLFETLKNPPFDWRSNPKSPYNAAVRSHYLNALSTALHKDLIKTGKTRDDLEKKLNAILQHTRSLGRKNLEYTTSNNEKRSRMTQEQRKNKYDQIIRDRRNQRKRKVCNINWLPCIY